MYHILCIILCIISYQIIDETLSPVWDELLLFEEILVYGRREDIKANPPTVIIEIYDQDKVVTFRNFKNRKSDQFTWSIIIINKYLTILHLRWENQSLSEGPLENHTFNYAKIHT